MSLTRPLPPGKHPNVKQERNFKELVQFKCSRRWVLAGLGSASLGALALASQNMPAVAALGTAGAVGFAYATVIEPRLPVLERVTVRLPNLPPQLEGLRIGQLSDQHLGVPHTRTNTAWAIQQMHNEQPDLIALTGDFVNTETAIPGLHDLFCTLRAPLGVYAVTGNHDHWEGVDDIRAQLEPLGVRFLNNENCRLRWRGAEFWLAGIDDMWYGAPDLHAALQGIPGGAFTVLLAHEPDFADIAALRPVDLQLSGHTHGGHIHLPLLGSPCLPHHGLRYVSGLVRVKDMQLYVTRGLGGMPVRFNCPPEATILTLARA